MTLEEMWAAINPAWKDIGVVVIILSIIQIAPIKLNPWSWLKAFFSMPKRMETLEHKITMLEAADDENMAIQARVRILRFADEVRNGHQRGEESYQQTLLDIDRYRRYCDRHPEFKNEKSVSAIRAVRALYDQHKQANDFIDKEDES